LVKGLKRRSTLAKYGYLLTRGKDKEYTLSSAPHGIL